jgi:hypothetical protein
MQVDFVARRSAFAMDSDCKMSWFENQPPGGSGAAAADSEHEADDQTLSKIRSMCAVAMTGAERMAQAIHTDTSRLNRLRFHWNSPR